jgi:Transcription factor WhiB
MTGAFSDQFGVAFDGLLPNLPRAACKDAEIPPDSWFPDESAPRAQLTQARAICSTCPVMVECREWAVAMYIDFGLWGNTTPRQRRKLRKDRDNGESDAFMATTENRA